MERLREMPATKNLEEEASAAGFLLIARLAAERAASG
jgi:hypothetical protein